MARSIVVRWHGETSDFTFARLDRERLYGRKERQVMDADGQRCTSAWLSADGAALVPTGGMAMLYVDDNFNTIERALLKTVDDSGVALAIQPSTLGIEQELEGPIMASRILDYAIHTVYILTADTVAPQLAAALAMGQIFAVPFNFRDDYERQILFILGNEAGFFALIGTTLGFALMRRDIVPESTDSPETDELADDFDFSMM